eukprot:328479-Pleurochrysis_carterae.AAC.5
MTGISQLSRSVSGSYVSALSSRRQPVGAVAPFAVAVSCSVSVVVEETPMGVLTTLTMAQFSALKKSRSWSWKKRRMMRPSSHRLKVICGNAATRRAEAVSKRRMPHAAVEAIQRRGSG